MTARLQVFFSADILRADIASYVLATLIGNNTHSVISPLGTATSSRYYYLVPPRQPKSFLVLDTTAMVKHEALSVEPPVKNSGGTVDSGAESARGGIASSIRQWTTDFFLNMSLAQSLQQTLEEMFSQELGYQPSQAPSDSGIDVETIIEEAHTAASRTSAKESTLTARVIGCTLTRLQQLDVSDEELDQIEDTLNTLFADLVPDSEPFFSGARRGRTRIVTLRQDDLPALLKMIAYDRAERISQLPSDERAATIKALGILCSPKTSVKTVSAEHSKDYVDSESELDESDGGSS